MCRLTLMVTLALLATGAAPPPAGDGTRATLLQISLPDLGQAEAATRRKVMEEETGRITSCTNAFDLGKRLQGRGLHGTLKVDVKTNFALAALPQPLRTALLSQPVGRATPVYGGSNALRVLIRCEPDFRIPGKIVPARRQSEKPIAI
jgi:hypothetical protein